MSDNPIFDPRHAYDDGVHHGKMQLDEATRMVLRRLHQENVALRDFCKRVSSQKNIPRWITRRAAELAEEAKKQA